MTSTEERLLRPIRRRRATSMTRTMTPALASGMPAVQRRRAKTSTSTSSSWRRCGRTGTWKDTARATMPATRTCWIPWAMRRSCFRTSTRRSAPALDAWRPACAGVTPGSGGHEDSLPRRAGWPPGRRPSNQETLGLDDGHPAFQGASGVPVARCALRWESLSGRPAVGRRPTDRPALRMRV